ncbi:MAG: beta-glucosidase BglX [Candidatus Cryptobacteroides sp.]
MELYRILFLLQAVLLISPFPAMAYPGYDNKFFLEKADSVLKIMTLEEKVGQMNQYAGSRATGPKTVDTTIMTQIAQGRVGSILNVVGSESTRRYQEQAMKSRLRIPLIFGQDVIHGLYTTFPIPLAEASSFDLDMIEKTARWAAVEASAAGIHWTFAPMVDISRDPRWGRVMEGAGEDPWLGSEVAKARVTGFQGDDLNATKTILACCKHFAGYGAVTAGKDYNSVDMSLGNFANYYMPPYKAACDAGASTFMNAFNDFYSIPCTANHLLLETLLREKWKFAGFVVSDWGSVGETVKHRYAEDRRDAAEKCVLAGCDMDMESRCYIDNLVNLVREGKVEEKLIDNAVRRILVKKFELGLFDNPFRYCDKSREIEYTVNEKTREDALKMAERSIVLLKNQGDVLPLGSDVKSVALIGALGDSRKNQSGFWAGKPVREKYVTLRDALEARGLEVNYVPAYDESTLEVEDEDEALSAAKQSDVILVCAGEFANQSGEAKSKADINVNQSQQDLVVALSSLGKPVISLIMGGRPQIFNDIGSASAAILCTWWLGTEAGNAICNVLWGDYNPSARLPMTFPKHIGQIPIYYNYKSTGRPGSPAKNYSSSYLDMDYLPAYPFGYGLSYTKFEYSDLKVIPEGGVAKVSVDVTNAGPLDGEEVVMLYVRDEVASVTRPVRELKGFRKMFIKAGETATATFELSEKELGFYDNGLNYIVEPGKFTVMTGPVGGKELSEEFLLVESPQRSPKVVSVLEILNVNTGKRRIVKEFPYVVEAPNWSPDGKWLVCNSKGKLFRIAPEAGAEPETIDSGFADRCNNDHVISSDGKYLGISNSSSEDRQSRIYRLPFGGGTPQMVTNNAPSYLHGWSPDMKTMVYCAARGDNYDVYSISSKGGKETRLTTAPGLDDGPEYSPDGKNIWFNSVRSGLMQIWRMDSDGKSQTRMSYLDDKNCWFPHISPDGEKVVYIAYNKDDVEPSAHPANKNVVIYVQSAEGGEPVQIASFFGGQGSLNVNSWSPDSDEIAFVSYRLRPDFVNTNDIGNCEISGSAEYDSSKGEYVLTGSGENMWGVSDAFRYLWKEQNGDFKISFNLEFEGEGTVAHRKMGVALRTDDSSDSPCVYAAVHGDGLTALQFRRTKHSKTESIVMADVRYPKRIELAREGNKFTMRATDGLLSQASSVTLELGLPEECMLGFYVCSHSNKVIETAHFSNVVMK